MFWEDNKVGTANRTKPNTLAIGKYFIGDDLKVNNNFVSEIKYLKFFDQLLIMEN